jgi:hypothetical protein
LVRLIADENGWPKIDALRDSILRGRLTRVADFVRRTMDGCVAVSPPVAVVRDIEALGQWPFPALAGVVEVPVLRPDGTILAEPGYDPTTRLFYHPAPGLKVPPTPGNPSVGDVAAALAVIDEALGEFPYDSSASKANALGALLTPILRPAISGPVPLALLDAPQQGTGKSLLSSVIALTATGRAASMMAAPDNDEEWRKRITATLHAGASVITIDNIEGQLKSASLASVLTSEIWKDRVLGRSESIELPQRATWLATGNNIRLGGDLQRRSYWIRLDAQSPTPWIGRKFRHPDLLSWVSQNRGTCVAALLTLARAWFGAGRPSAKSSAVLGGFESWSKTVGGVLEHAGVQGFIGNLEALYSQADEEAEEWEQFLHWLNDTFQGRPFTTAGVFSKLEIDANAVGLLPDDLVQLWDKPGRAGSFAKSLGRGLRKRKGRRYGESRIHIEEAGNAGHAKRWLISGPAPRPLTLKAA